MSVFTSRITDTLPVPHDPGQSVTIRKLAPRHLEVAAKEALRQSLEQLRAMGGPSFIKQLQELHTSTVTQTEDPLAMFERVTLIEKGVLSWSYPEKPTRETIEDLDEETQKWLATAVLKLAKPSLYETVDAREAAQKEADATSSPA